MESGESPSEPDESGKKFVKWGIIIIILFAVLAAPVVYVIFIMGYPLLPPMMTPGELEQLESEDISIYSENVYFSNPTFTAGGDNILYLATTRPEDKPDGYNFSGHDWEYDIWVMDREGNNQTRITNFKEISNFGYSPFSGMTGFNSYKNGNTSIYILRDTESAPARISGPLQHMYFSSWSSDGTMLAATGLDPGDFSGWSVMDDGGKVPSPGGIGWSRLYIMNADGSSPREIALTCIPMGVDFYTESSWSPDGKKLVFPFCDPEESGLAVADAVTGETLKITINEEHDPDEFWWTGDYYPVWNPDGDLIAFIREGDVWTIMPDGTGEEKIVSDGTVEHLSWNPDGTRLAFSSESYLGIVDPDGSNLNRISNIQPGPLSWSPDGGTLTYAPGMGKRIRIMSLTPGVLKMGEYMAKQMDVFSGQ